MIRLSLLPRMIMANAAMAPTISCSTTASAVT